MQCRVYSFKFDIVTTTWRSSISGIRPNSNRLWAQDVNRQEETESDFCLFVGVNSTLIRKIAKSKQTKLTERKMDKDGGNSS